MTDKYQQRYLSHQRRKKKQLTVGERGKPVDYGAEQQINHTLLLTNRRSQRTFTREEIPSDILTDILESATYAPSSCNRHGIELLPIREQDKKELLSGLLVGGVGWIHRADTIVLLMANPDAYKSPYEKDFMHYCDAGFTAMNIWLKAESLNVGAAYVNPNIREENQVTFSQHFEDGNIFCGAMVLGYPDGRPDQADHPELVDILLSD